MGYDWTLFTHEDMLKEVSVFGKCGDGRSVPPDSIARWVWLGGFTLAIGYHLNVHGQLPFFFFQLK